MWGIFGKPLKRAIWNTLGLHAVLTVCLKFLSFLDSACVACWLFLSTGFVWVKSGYSEAIAWRKVRLTKQRNVDLTTDGLWAMPLNTGWVPVKARRLQDWEKLKKYVPSHKQGDVCPNGVPALVEGGNNDSDSDSE